MGVQNTLVAQGHALISISDLIPFHSRKNALEYFRVAFQLAARLDLDAVIVPAGSIVGYLTDADSLGELLAILDPSCTVVIEREIEGYRSVGKDNTAGMHECMNHLIEDCGFRHIAYIGGPAASAGAREREAVYREQMAAHGLDVTPSMIAYGDYSGECGDEIDKLIDSNPDIEAIACCCDLIAHSVYRVMRERGLQVGEDIAVTGFDDISVSAHLDPPLSTVHMTGYDLGCMAAREALLLCEGLPQEERILRSHFIARGSSGTGMHGRAHRMHQLALVRPFPIREVAGELVDATLVMADEGLRESFVSSMQGFVEQVWNGHQLHVEHPKQDTQLFVLRDFERLFGPYERAEVSLDGFQSLLLELLGALVEVSGEADATWSVRQAASLNQHIVRMLDARLQLTRTVGATRGWQTAVLAGDALRYATNIHDAHQAVLRDLGALGLTWADVYLLPEPVAFMDADAFMFSDVLNYVGSLCDGEAVVPQAAQETSLNAVLSRLLGHNARQEFYTLSGIMAGDDLVGVLAMAAPRLDEDGQLIATLSLGSSLKLLSMAAGEQESNAILSQHNLQGMRRSNFDGMTGALNRHGFSIELERALELLQDEMGALFYMDLDGLRAINRDLGHSVGDDAILQAAHILRKSLPTGSLLGRFGGDEFVAFANVEDGMALAQIGREIEEGVAEFNALHPGSYRLAVSYGGLVLPIGEGALADGQTAMETLSRRLNEMKRSKAAPLLQRAL